MALVPIILSGGAGTRLWPLSREAAPKPFMPLPGNASTGDTLLARTFLRAMATSGVAGMVTITNRDYYFHTKDTYSGTGATLPQRMGYLLEPSGRNTGPAVALGALYAEEVFGRDATLLVLPADHLIRDTAAFSAAVAQASTLARDGWLATFGIAPETPETGYGYLELGEALPVPGTFRARRFIEKPPLSDAQAYVASGRHVWNSGMFCFTAGSVLAAFEKHAPELLGAARPVWRALGDQVDGRMLEIDPKLFAAVPEISFDVAVMEKADRVAVVRGKFDWSDVGSWRAIADLAPADADGNRGDGERVSIATRNTYVHAADRVVATVGVDGLFVVETPDAVLVAHRDHVQRVKDVVGELKARGHDAYRFHKTVLRPWGAFTVLQEGPGFKIKRIEVKPGASLSLQLHHHRSEHWVVVGGEARVTNGERSYTLRENESTFIPVETRHRLENPGSVPLLLIEVQCGSYVGEDDIVRFDDKYGRVPA
ncbi:MAG TPA: mannose-1-phosphate guanylyltransferase/mannose-6-phosphate isomerase [Casimicrobiaceae bacterium]|nr:mannose-1-phosphate guanylyltransferase/mannose-6-phosphate isomerase [Casimicrobiaceae bacterium]